MAEFQNPKGKIIQRNGGFFQDFANRFRLIGRLMMDQRVNPFLKILPVGTLIYVFVPVDLLSLNPIDDAFIVWAGTSLFVELCPPQVVEEHMALLNRAVTGEWKDTLIDNQTPVSGDVIDGEFTEADGNESSKTSTR